MGNCQAAEAATAVLQHPDGKVERRYWATTAFEVMRTNPGHYVAFATTITLPHNHNQDKPPSTSTAAVRITKLRLLRPKESLVLGQVYRLVTSQEVVKALKARKQERMGQQKHKQQQRREEEEKTVMEEEHVISDQEQTVQESGRAVRHRQKTTAAARARQWRPSLQSISEAMS